MASADSNYFRELPPLTSEAVAKLKVGHKLSLVLLEYVGDGVGVLFSVQYIHREVLYRSSNDRDAVAFGTAKLEGESDFQEVRILFSKPNATATLRGLALQGQVKVGIPRA